MYLPKHFAIDDRNTIREVLRSTPFGHLVTGGGGTELLSTPLPFVIDDKLTTVPGPLLQEPTLTGRALRANQRC